MKIKGNILTLPSSCKDLFKDLHVEILSKSVGLPTKKLATLEIDDTGSFEYTHEEKVLGSIYINLQLVDEDGTVSEVREFGPYCNQEEINIQYYFKPKEHVIWFPFINSQIQKVLGDGTLHAVEEKEYELLSCQACVELADIKELNQCYNWRNELIKIAKNCMASSKKANPKDKGNEQFHKDRIESLNRFINSNDIQELLFAFVQGNLDQELARVLSLSSVSMKEILATAVEAKRISINEKVIDEMVISLSYIRDCLLLTSAYDDNFYDAKILHISTLPLVEKQAYLDQVLEKGSLSQVLDEGIEEESSKKKSSKTKLQETQREELTNLLNLDKLVGNFPPLLKNLAPSLREKKWDESLLLSLTEKDWVEKISEVGSKRKYPYGYDDIESPIEAYATDIYKRLSVNYPSAKASLLIKSSTIPGKTALSRILNNAKDFDLENTAASQYFEVAEKAEKENEVTKAELKKVQEFQRTAKLAGGVTEISTIKLMYDENLTSSARIIKRGRNEVERALADGGVRSEQINMIYCRARARYDLLTEVATNYIRFDSLDAPLPPSLVMDERVESGDSTSQSSGALPSAYELPNLQELFGSMDSCNCKHCQSVYSPAAYLTDLLHWMSSEVECGATNRSAFQVLDTRRPDVKYIHLNCKNSNTILPYIDLVNEILLAYINTGNINTLLQELQTTKSSEELLLRPEHLDNVDFDVSKGEFRKAKRSWALPYDLDWDRSRNYLDKLGYPSWRLAEQLGISKSSKWWINERLGLMSHQVLGNSSIDYWDWNILLDSSLTSVKTNYYSGTLPSTAEQLLHEANISFDELKKLLQVEFIVQDSDFDISPADGCQLNEIELVSFTNAVALRLMKFMKLHIRTKLSYSELDHILQAIGATSITADVLKTIAQLIEVSETLEVNIQHVLSIVGITPILEHTLSTQEVNTYYKERFLSFGSSQNLFSKERLDSAGLVDDFLPSEWDVIAGMFSLSQDELSHFLPLATTWDLAKVTQLLKVELLLKSTSLSFEDFIYVHNNYSSVDINLVTDIQSYYDFLISIEKVEGFEMSIEELVDGLQLTGDWVLPSPVDLTNVLGENLSDSFMQFSSLLPSISPGSFHDIADLTNAAIPVLAILFNQEENLINSQLGGITFTASLSAEDFYAQAYRIIKRTQILNDEIGLDIESIYSNNSHTILPALTSYFTWLTVSSSASAFDDIEGLHWLKEAMKHSENNVVTQHEFLELANQLLSYSPINSSDLDVFGGDFYSSSSIASLNSLTEVQVKDLFAKSYAIEQNQDLNIILSRAQFILNLSVAFNLSVTETWNIVYRNQSITGPTASNAISNSSLLLQNSLDTILDDHDTIKTVEDEIRINLRDHLLAYHLNNSAHNFENSNAVFAYYLLDPEMDACFKTSRIKLALSGSQLLMHRAIMGLEPALCPSTDNVKEWEWRQNYRVWEANRKVFLYAENWVDPTLRIEKSELFEALEDSILQDEVTTENCEKAVSEYLVGLNKIARLDIRATYTETVEENGNEIIHVFGRTFTTPHEYYYRSREVSKKWTPWAKLELDIEGDHLIPTFFNRKLYLIWPMFIEKEHRKIKRVIDGEEQNAPYYEIKLCYSKFEFGKWSSKKLFDATMLAGHYGGKGCFNNIRHKLGKDVAQGIVGYDTETTVFPLPFPGFIIHEREIPIVGPIESDNGNLVLSNANYQDYAKVSLERSAFYFWPQLLNGNLVIHVRRDFHEDWDSKHYAYSEMAYEDSFLISACDEKATVIPPIFDGDENGKRFLARPYNTLPQANRMIRGLDNPRKLEDKEGLYVKKQITHAPGSVKITQKANSPYILTYPIENKHSMSDLPFFLTDEKHTLFFERKKERICRKFWGYQRPNDYTGNYYAFYEDIISPKYTVQSHDHPYVCLMLSEFNKGGFEGLYNTNLSLLNRQLGEEAFFENQYQPISTWINSNHPINTFDFNYLSPYGIYNMEVFFHIPSLIARQLKSNGKYRDAIKWLQFVFDPTNRDMNFGTNRFWKIKPFFENISNVSIQNLMALLGAGNLSPEQEAHKEALQAQIEAWESNPFEPHRIAEMRMRTYMLWTVYEYVDVLIQWGDSLFSQDTMESINEATNLYILASEILGRRPMKIDKPESDISTSFHEIRNALDDFSNTIDNLENEIPGYNPAICCEQDRTALRDQNLPDLLFCIPDNPKVLELWDRVEDRLFKIRHCMNIEGQVRDLALFQPPIDPALLVRARAMGISIGDVLSDLNAPEPFYRFSYLIQKANEYTNELKSLSGQLLSALEKKDSEELSQIRQLHERNILKATKNIKKLQLEEAKNGLKSLEYNKKLIEIRLDEYSGKEYKNNREEKALSLTKKADKNMKIEQSTMLLAKVFGLIPQMHIGALVAAESGGLTMASITDTVGTTFGVAASIQRNKASMSSTYGGYDRRQEDWDFQVKTATEELKQIDKQILGAEIRIAITEKELANHELQMQQSAEIYDFLRSKFTNEKLYGWMSTELSKLSHKAYKLALDVAKQAQKAYEKELGISADFIETGYWDGSKKGLLSGEKLSLQLKALDDAYMKNDKRKFELNKSVSLRLLDPVALVDLIENDLCTVTLPSDILNLEFVGKVLKDLKIRSLSVSIPSVTGPYVSTNIKLAVGTEEIISSTGVNDTGEFDANPSQVRYLPFEYKEINPLELKIMLPRNIEFDKSTISDVILNINYQAETDDSTTSSTINPVTEAYLMMSWKHDFPLEWQKFISGGMASTARPLMEWIEGRIPYKYSLQGLTGNSFVLANSRVLTTDVDGKPSLDQFGWTDIILNVDNQLEVEGNEVDDVWLMFKLS